MSRLHVLTHPLLQHKLSILRDKTTNVKVFREVVGEMAMLMCYEATRDLPLMEVDVKTPLGTSKAQVIAGKKLAVVPILRAGLGMLDGILSLMPGARVGHIGLYRNPETLQPVEYYCKMPIDIEDRDVLLLEPMLATGGSASAAVQFVKNYQCKSVRLLSLLASKQGASKLESDHPDIDIYVCGVDPELSAQGFVVPGLGDVGSRMFGTE